jgi:hypothetical protein
MSDNDQQAEPRRRQLRWSKEARDLVAEYVRKMQAGLVEGDVENRQLRKLITALAALTGNPRQSCSRFARQLGVTSKQTYQEWTRSEQQRLLDLISLNPANEVAKLMRRSPGAIRQMLRRLGANAQMGRDWFTMFTLAQALHISPEQVQKWINSGWLKCRIVDTGKLRKQVIDADEFARFCKEHRTEIVGRRLSAERLEFVRTFVFPPSHTELLPVRESKKERAAYDIQSSPRRREHSRSHAETAG